MAVLGPAGSLGTLKRNHNDYYRMPSVSNNEFYDCQRQNSHTFDPEKIKTLFTDVDKARVDRLADNISGYLTRYLPKVIEGRKQISDYKTNPYVLMAAASTLNLDHSMDLASFLGNSKIYMSLETSFGKSIESIFLQQYPITGTTKWAGPIEKEDEFATYKGLNLEERAQARDKSVWREIDSSVVTGKKRYLVTIKSGPRTINDTQVKGMTDAIANNSQEWLRQSREIYTDIDEIDVVIGLTYGTDKSTNNKENQILVKLLKRGFVEEDMATKPGVLIDKATHSIRVYRNVGFNFWSFVGNPDDPSVAEFVFLEVLLGLAKGLATGRAESGIEAQINARMKELGDCFSNLTFSRRTLPAWVDRELKEEEILWLSTALTAFFDDGI